MVNQLEQIKAELLELGFYFSEENTAVGRVPQNGEECGYYITVEVLLEGFPLKQPLIRLQDINGNNELYRVIPSSWRHVDESLFESPITSHFYICCLHNWTAKIEYDGSFIYQRILDWLKSNVSNRWDVREDLVSWRISPQYSQMTIYLPKGFLKHFKDIKPKTLYNIDVHHSPFLLKNGTVASTKKRGETYDYNIVDFTKSCVFFPEFNGDKAYNTLKNLQLTKAYSSSTMFLVRLPRNFAFKTLYQLIQSLKHNIAFKSLNKDINTIILLVMYTGDHGRTEVVSFITGREVFEKNSEFHVSSIKTESMPERPQGIDLTIGMLGVGSLGSQTAKLLVEKDVKGLLLADYDKMALENLGRHILGSFHIGDFKSIALRDLFSGYYLHENVMALATDDEVIDSADVVVVTVGNSQKFDWFAFEKLLNYKKPIIWAWTSANNILQEIVITTPQTGCLNCYYHEINTDEKLKSLQEIAQTEIDKYTSNEIDICGNPHTISQMERMVFLATQIVSIISFYNKYRKFKFDFVNYYWGMDEIIPTPMIGYLIKNKSCFCTQESQ
ncbi:ThiF family adenylyltransferase [Metabacillus niabensis]|uniref:ThiF family adenylyltransferase n=1 Tax=Metabacillus niabensis TaxID=324854 RepID=UPI0009C54530|nr:UBA/THIF-type NAD/FAD binding protein [Mycobacteroides abscessus subsp. abscessus]